MLLKQGLCVHICINAQMLPTEKVKGLLPCKITTQTARGACICMRQTHTVRAATCTGEHARCPSMRITSVQGCPRARCLTEHPVKCHLAVFNYETRALDTNAHLKRYLCRLAGPELRQQGACAAGPGVVWARRAAQGRPARYGLRHSALPTGTAGSRCWRYGPPDC